MAAGALWGQASANDCASGYPCVTLSTSSNSLAQGQPATLTALVNANGSDLRAVAWTLSPAGVGALGAGNPVNSAGESTNIYVAPASIAAHQTVTITAAAVSAAYGTSASYSVPIQLTPPPITVSPATASPSAGATVQFTQTGAATVAWSLNPSVASVDGGIDPTSGLYTAPASITSAATVTVTATSTADSSVTGTAKIALTAPAAVSVTVSPASATLTAGQTQQFTAAVANAANTAVAWSLSPAGVGGIDSTGLYTAPSSIADSQKVTVTATSAADPTKTGSAAITLSVFIDVGTGAPTPTLQAEFIQAFYRNGFNNLVATPPQGQVASLGGGVYGQKFSDAAKDSGVTYALATASASVNPAPDGSSLPVAQMYPGVFAYYSTLGASTAGAPLSDTLNCPFFQTGNSCTYQAFDKNYVLFAFASALASGVQDAPVTPAFYASWTSLGGLGGPGIPIADSATLTASTGTTATAQTYTSGEIFSVTSGLNKGQTFGVIEPVFDLYMASGGAAGSLGLPTGSAVTFTSGASAGVTQQAFEGGLLVYTPGSGGTVQVPVGSVVLTGPAAGSSFTLELGQTMTLSATVFDQSGNPLTGRSISWVGSSSQVLAVQANGATATLTAVGGGTATVAASSGGITSARVTVVVTAPCCQIGDGAPLAVGNAFQAALGRDRIAVQLPVADPAARVGNGYVQTVQAMGASGAAIPYLLTDADQASAAYVVTGALLAAYQSMGGAGGTLGYPLGDASAGGTQLFAGGALAGSPIRLVTGLVLAKWQALGYETGVAGAPAGDAAPFSTIDADTGTSQAFAQGTIYAATAGPRAGQAYFVSGPILTAYAGAGGAAGSLGMPVSDETVSGALHSQTFEGGAIGYPAGATAATVQAAPKTPAVLVAPATVTAGGHAVFAIAGFPNNSTVRVSVTGEPDFLVTTANGAYGWDTYIPLASPGGTLAIHAADTHGPSVADGTLTVRSLAASRAGLAKVQGDNQTGLPGAAPRLPLVVELADSSGAPVIGVTVTFQASPGVQLSVASAVTDGAGQAQTGVRLPASTGLALVTASAPVTGTSLVTFSLVAAASNLPGFPAMQQSGSAPLGHGTATIAQKGALLTAVASILQYHQNQGELPSPNGLATPAALNAYLTSLCSPDSHGQAVCDGFLSGGAAGEQIVNPWRAAEFTGGVDVTVAGASVSQVADLVAQGEPVLLSLGLSRNGVPAGGHFVTAMGVAADGSLEIQDPNPLLARASLADYISGFTAGGAAWQGTVLGAVRFAVRGPAGTRFLAGVLEQPAGSMPAMVLNITSAAGACGAAWPVEDTVDASGNPPAEGALVSLLRVCDGAQPAYQLDVGAPQPYRAFVTDLAAGGSAFDLSGNAAASYALTRPQPAPQALVVAPLAAAMAADGIVNAAAFTSGLAPGGIMAIFGTGLAGAGTATAVDVDGVAAPVLFASAFQVNAQIPPGTAPGLHTVRVKSAYGTAQQQAAVEAVAPAIFLLGAASAGAVLNQDNSLNTALTPLARGQVLQVYATGLGATVKQGQYAVVETAVTAVVNGTELPVSFAGLAPGFVGLYQVNIPIPAATPPGSGVSLTLKQGGQISNAVEIALQ
jgi:uncharacterized protein (TIGR03437 family)